MNDNFILFIFIIINANVYVRVFVITYGYIPNPSRVSECEQVIRL